MKKKQLTPQNLKGKTKPKSPRSSLVAEMRKTANERVLRQKKFRHDPKDQRPLKPLERQPFRWEQNVGGEIPKEVPETDLAAHAKAASPPPDLPQAIVPKQRIDSRIARAKIKAKMEELHSEKFADGDNDDDRL